MNRKQVEKIIGEGLVMCEVCGCLLLKATAKTGKPEVRFKLVMKGRWEYGGPISWEREEFIYHPHYCFLHNPADSEKQLRDQLKDLENEEKEFGVDRPPPEAPEPPPARAVGTFGPAREERPERFYIDVVEVIRDGGGIIVCLKDILKNDNGQNLYLSVSELREAQEKGL